MLSARPVARLDLRRWGLWTVAFAAFVTLLAPLVHNIDHQPDHVHGPHGIVRLGQGWSWGGRQTVHAHDEASDDRSPGAPEPKRDSDEKRTPAPDHGRQALEHFQSWPVVGDAAPSVVLDGWCVGAALEDEFVQRPIPDPRRTLPLCRGPPLT